MPQSVSIPCQRNIHNGNRRAYRASVRFDLFSSGRLLAALKEAEYPDLPAPRTLSWWIHNDAPPEALRLFVSEVLLERKEAAPPQWAERLIAMVDQIYQTQGQLADDAGRRVIEALAPDDLRQAALEADARLAAELERSRRRSDERAGGPTAAPGGGSLGSKRQSPK
jgi:hypothetical protein